MQHVASEIAVEPLKVAGLDVAKGQNLISIEGYVWVTVSDRGSDIILGPGDSIKFDKRGRAVVGGLRSKGVRVRLDDAHVN